MKMYLGLIVLAGSVAFAPLAAAQSRIPAPPAPPAAPTPVAEPLPAPPAPPAATPVAMPSAAPEAMPAPPSAPTAPTPLAAPPAPPSAPAAPIPVAQATQRPPAPPKPAKPAETPKAAEAPPAPPEAPVRERYDTDPVNVRFEVTVSSQTGAASPVKRSAIVTVSNGALSGPTGNGMLRSGNQIPVATTTLTTKGEDGKETPAARPVASYNYRSVGLNVDVSNVAILASGRVRALLNIEVSGVDDKSATTTGAPSFPTFSQRLSLFFDSGKALVVAQSSDLVDNVERKQTVEIKATILR
jgi:hypothetical protein